MTAMEKWNRIVEYVGKYISSKENIVQDVWENIFSEIFGYSRLDGDIDSHRQVQIGSTERVIADIIIKDDSTDMFVVELKQHNMTLINEMEHQLFSYLKQTKNDIGILICNKIYVYDYDYNMSDDSQDKVEIEFTSDNPNGEMFVELFCKAAFTPTAVKNFVHQQNKFSKNVECISKNLSQNIVIELLTNHFSSEFDAEEIEVALGKFNISVAPISASSVVQAQMPYVSIDTMSEAAFSFAPSVTSGYNDGRTERGGNERVVFEVLLGLQTSGRLNDTLIGQLKSPQFTNQTFNVSTFPFLLPTSEFNATGYERSRFYRRTFTHNGVEYLVCSQWIPKRMTLLKKWYGEISML